MSKDRPEVTAFFDAVTSSVTYLVADGRERRAVVIDPVLDFDMRSGRTATRSADRVLDAVRERGLTVDLILETHVHADHLTAASYLKQKLGAPIGIGANVAEVQRSFAAVFAAQDPAARVFDRLFSEGERFAVGSIPARVLATPGHTPACVAYHIGDALFVGDTIFMPDYGSARCDFPGGSAQTLYRSIRRLFDTLPGETRVFVGHDYAPGGRPHAWETTLAEQRAHNKHLNDGVDEDAFIAMRTARDRELELPALIIPAIQVNLRAGRLPPKDENGVAHLRLPVNWF